MTPLPPPLELEGCGSGLFQTFWGNCRFIYTFLLLRLSLLPRHNAPGPKIANRTFHTAAQWRLPGQVGAWSDTEGILFVGFRLHGHHYHLSHSESWRRSAATPILNGGCAPVSSGAPAIESTKRTFGAWNVAVLAMDVHPRPRSDLIMNLPPCWLEPSASSLQMKFF